MFGARCMRMSPSTIAVVVVVVDVVVVVVIVTVFVVVVVVVVVQFATRHSAMVRTRRQRPDEHSPRSVGKSFSVHDVLTRKILYGSRDIISSYLAWYCIPKKRRCSFL